MSLAGTDRRLYRDALMSEIGDERTCRGPLVTLRSAACRIILDVVRQAPGECFSHRATGVAYPSVVGRKTVDALGEQISGCRVPAIAETERADRPFALVDHWRPAIGEASARIR